MTEKQKTSARDRIRKRRDRLDAFARQFGLKGWSAFETACLDGRVFVLRVEGEELPPPPAYVNSPSRETA